MRTVLDEGVPRQIIPLLLRAGCAVEPFPKGWKGLKNGELVKQLIVAGFDCLVTCDKNFEYQQNLKTAGLAVAVLPAQRLGELTGLIPEIAVAISTARTGTVARVTRRS